MLKTKKFWYILLFSILYLIVAGSSFWHAIAFFGLANNTVMSIILAFAFEVGQAAVLFSLLTSKKDRNRVIPWALMTMFTLVQVIGNVYSSYKYIISNSVSDLRYFKEPIFIWTQLPDDQATVIITYVVGAILPIAALLLTSMITNYLTDEEEAKQLEQSLSVVGNLPEEGPSAPIIVNDQEEFNKTYNETDEEQPIETVGDQVDTDIEEEQPKKPSVNIIEHDNTLEEPKYNSVDEAIEHVHENEGISKLEEKLAKEDPNLQQADMLMGGNILRNKDKDSHFININKK